MIFENPVKVRLCETDALGHISNISYIIYLEEACTNFFAELGFGNSIKSWKIILASVTCDFVSQGYYKQELVVQLEVSRIGNSSFQLVYGIKDADNGELLAKGQVNTVHFNFEAQKSEILPKEQRQKLEMYLINKEKDIT